MRLPHPRGPLSAAVIDAVREADTGPLASLPPVEGDDVWAADAQLALWVAYELHYRGFDDRAAAGVEWDPGLLAWRRDVEAVFETAVRRLVEPDVAAVRDLPDADSRLTTLIDSIDGPPLSRHLQRRADREQVVDFLRERSLYHLKESDPSAFVLPRLDGRAKVALAELLYDEYGGGRPQRLHSALYAEAIRACGLDPSYGAYVDTVSAATLASNNVMSLFGLHHRLRGASLGHLAAFEATSTDPSRRIAAGVERVGLGGAVADYFHEHVEADAVHEQVVLGDICGALVEDQPALTDDVLLGAAACLVLDGAANADLMRRWGVLDGGPTLVPAPRCAGEDREQVA
jgi:hypothetical protein